MVKRVLTYKTYFVKSWSYWCYLLENPSLSKTEFEQRNRDLMLTISAWWIRRPSGFYAVTIEKEKLSRILNSPHNSFCLIVTLCRLSLIASLSNQHILVSFLLIFFLSYNDTLSSWLFLLKLPLSVLFIIIKVRDNCFHFDIIVADVL